MPNELELCVVSAVIGALLGGAVTYTVVHKLDGAVLAHEQKAHADDIARINATAAQQLTTALAHQQAAEGAVYTLQQQYDNEVAQHAKDSLNYRAELLAGTERVRVRLSGCSGSSASSKSPAPAPGTDGPASYGFLSPQAAASVIAVADDADTVKAQLIALQQYVTELQKDGFISDGK
jgi:prophage endopeptidase